MNRFKIIIIFIALIYFKIINANNIDSLIVVYNTKTSSQFLFNKVWMEMELWKNEFYYKSENSKIKIPLFINKQSASEVKIKAIPVIRFKGKNYDPNIISAVIDTNIYAGLVYNKGKYTCSILCVVSKGKVTKTWSTGNYYGSKKNEKYIKLLNPIENVFYEPVIHAMVKKDSVGDYVNINQLFITANEKYSNHIYRCGFNNLDSTYYLRYGRYINLEYASSKEIKDKYLSLLSDYDSNKPLKIVKNILFKRDDFWENFNNTLRKNLDKIELRSIPVIDRKITNSDLLKEVVLSSNFNIIGYLNNKPIFIVEYDNVKLTDFEVILKDYNKDYLNKIDKLLNNDKGILFYDNYLGFYGMCYNNKVEVMVGNENVEYRKFIKRRGIVTIED